MNKHLLMLAVVLLAATGCTATPASIDTSADAVLTYDGLAPVKNASFREAWADPDIDFTQYNKIILGDAQFEFRAVKKGSSSSTMRRSNETEFWIDDKSRERLVETVSAVFREELATAKGFTITEERGADTLVLVGALHDIVSRVPPEHIGRGEIYLSSVGEATLVIEARDSLSGETIYRAIERRAIERPGAAIQANTVTTWAEVRRWARRWATRLREGLESIHE
jgi:hypothetical protein